MPTLVTTKTFLGASGTREVEVVGKFLGAEFTVNKAAYFSFKIGFNLIVVVRDVGIPSCCSLLS